MKLARRAKRADNARAMATVNFTAGIDRVSAKPAADLSGAISDERLPLFRFGLRQLFVFVAGISALFTVLGAIQGLPALVILLAIVIVAAHVFATALGGRLRAKADREQVFESLERLPVEAIATTSERLARVALVRSQPRSPWHARGATSLPWLRRLVIAAIALGGMAGAAYLAVTIGYRTSPAGVIVGSVSVAVLCGWFAFLCGSFYGVFRHGFREAVANER
jgi:hypothetical protein